MFRSLRSRLIAASLLWTAGLLLLLHLAALAMLHALPRIRAWNPHVPSAIGLLLMAGGFLAARRALAPFAQLRRSVEAVRSGEAMRIEGEYPEEVRPLIESIDELIANREKAIARAHATAGDLAHALKTPLALIESEAEAARAAGQNRWADAISEQVRRMAHQVDYQLARARVAASGPTGAAHCDVAACAATLIRTLAKLHAGRQLSITASIAQGLAVRARCEDLEEIFGNLLDNACKWARSSVAIAAAEDGAAILVTIDDDGPGLAGSLREAVLQRGVRIDEAAPGSGLGLSIVRDLSEHYGGSIALETSPAGGLRVLVTLPRAIPTS